MWIQKIITLKAKTRGFHLVTSEVLAQIPEINDIRVGMMHVFMQHTSASLTINENADPSVREDFESFFNEVVAENKSYFTHTYEGSDDMPAHLKGSILGFDLNIPITNGLPNLGTWQGIYLCEHRNHGGQRKLVITIQGE
ncbi:MAG TPA: YjbQ family protein [Thiomicrospira sp.]|jgi:secondary thiamine-phosphate synthase enzyme|nr:YjbQ family protein [Thiomicrospira sp.]